METCDTVEASFASKILATIDPKMPIMDKYVLKSLSLGSLNSVSKAKKSDKAKALYNELIDKENELLQREDIKNIIAKIRKYLSSDEKYNILTDMKILDFILWSKRSESDDITDEND